MKMTEKIKIELEFPIHASLNFLQHYLVSPDGLGEWFADNVNSRGEIYTFFWEGTEEQASQKILSKDNKVRYHWLEEEDEDVYFEFKIVIDALTNDLALIVTDFADEDEVEDQKLFWENQIDTLKRCIGA